MKPIRYKNATIDMDYGLLVYGKYIWVHDEYDSWYEGEDQHSSGSGIADTIEECKEQIDEWIKENEL